MAKSKSGIIWLASYPKSGNTWTRSFLNNLRTVQEHGLRADAHGINEMNRLTSWDIGGSLYKKLTGKTPDQLGYGGVAQWRARIQAEIADESPDAMLVKTHNALVLDDGKPTINMAVTSGVVYIVRNPLDVAVSFAHHLGRSIDDAIKIMNQRGHRTPCTEQSAHEVYGSWTENVMSWTQKPNPALFVMRYEDMHADPQKQFGALARHIGMGANRKQIERAVTLSSFKTLQEQEKAVGYKEKPKMAETFFRKGITGEWKEALSPEQVRAVVGAHHPQMQRYGYLDDPELAEIPRPGLQSTAG